MRALGTFMQDTGLKKSWIKWAFFGATIFLHSCNEVDTQATQGDDEIKRLETSQASIKSTMTIGKRVFDVTYVGDFNDPVCLAIKKTLNELPNNVDVITQVSREYPSEVFRLDILIDALRDTDLPFIQWETVPENERLENEFSLGAVSGYLKKLDTQTVSDDWEYYFHIFDEPKAELEDDEYVTYDKWRRLPDVLNQENWPIKKYRLNKTYTLYDYKPEHPFQNFSEEQLLDWNWKDDGSPYFASDYDIVGLAITLQYPFNKGAAEISLGNPFRLPNSLDNLDYKISELIWDGEILTAISFDYELSSILDRSHSFKVTKFNSADFTTSEFFENFSKPTPIKQIQEQEMNLLLSPKSIDVCDLTLLSK